MLELLAASDAGATDALLLAHGFTLDVIVSIVSGEFATAEAERTLAGGRGIQVTQLRITEAGRRALAERQE
jgi:hypothetical protein